MESPSSVYMLFDFCRIMHNACRLRLPRIIFYGILALAGNRSTLALLRFCVSRQLESLWITRRIRRISAFPSNSERLDASVFTSTLPATKRNSRTISTRATDVIFERKHCSRRRGHTQVEITSPHKQLGNSETIARNRWHGARIS